MHRMNGAILKNSSEEPSVEANKGLTTGTRSGLLSLLVIVLGLLVWASQTLVPPDRAYTYSGAILICGVLVVFIAFYIKPTAS